MEYAVISTVNNLELCLYNQSKYLMCLAWLALENKQYKEFFTKASEDKYVILDNGANEQKQLKGKELVDLAIEIGAKEIIAPDVWRDFRSTVEESSKFYHENKEAIDSHKINLMGVVQGSNMAEVIECIKCFQAMPFIHTIGYGFDNYDFHELPNTSKTMRGSMARLYTVQATAHLVSKPIHLLGNYNPLEIKYHSKDIRSTDSSSPVLCAMFGIPYDISIGIKEKPAKYLDFNGKLTQRQVDLFKSNILAINLWLGRAY